MRLLAPGVPAVEIVHRHERYSLPLRVSPGSRRDILAIECRLDGDDKLKVYALLALHLGATGYANTAAVVSHHGRVTLCAEQGPFGAALAAVDAHQRDAIGWARHDIADVPTCDTGLGFHVAALDLSRLSPGARVDFTWRWQESGNWIGGDYSVMMEPAGDPE